ncbi:MAG: hypothetical protein HY787_25070 [Deltaproteobacteria bacterium]|nr:hypothetical protein [Deltaproteobacteria bacterium]
MLKGLGYEYLFQRYAGYGHGSLYDEDEWILPAQWLKEAPARNINPARVTYKTCEAWWRPDISQDLVFDKAYWVSGLRVRDTSLGTTAYGLIDVTTYALKGSNPGVETVGGDGYTPTNNNYYTYTGQNYVWPDKALPLRNRFEMHLTNLKSVTLDPARMGLRFPYVSFTVDSDGPATLTLTGRSPFCKILMDNKIYHNYTLTAGDLTVDIPEGQHEFKLLLLTDLHKY